METVSDSHGYNANSNEEVCCRENEVTKSVTAVAAALWQKPGYALAHLTGASDRMCRYWLTGRHRMTAEALAELLRTDDGYKFLNAAMGDATPLWWMRFKDRFGGDLADD